MASQNVRTVEIAPSAGRLAESLRDIGYEFHTAVADVVDNAISAGASRVDIDIEFDGPDSWVSIADDGQGMSSAELTEAMRFGTRREYAHFDRGRYGLGLKTASLSQCRRMSILSRKSETRRGISQRTLDLDQVKREDAWIVMKDLRVGRVPHARNRLLVEPGTVVLWEKLDRVLDFGNPAGGWAKRRVAALASRTSAHLGLVFHRFLEGEESLNQIVITVNGEKVPAWNPYAPNEPHTQVLPQQTFQIEHETGVGTVRTRGFILPPKSAFSSPSEWERLSGPDKWNRQQGIYYYRAGRLVRWGGWGGVRAIDEHTKLARMQLDFDTVLDDIFHIDVAKMRVVLPSVLKKMAQRPITELCLRAEDVYRKSGDAAAGEGSRDSKEPHSISNVGLGLKAAAMRLGHSSTLEEIIALACKNDPSLEQALGVRH